MRRRFVTHLCWRGDLADSACLEEGEAEEEDEEEAGDRGRTRRPLELMSTRGAAEVGGEGGGREGKNSALLAWSLGVVMLL